MHFASQRAWLIRRFAAVPPWFVAPFYTRFVFKRCSNHYFSKVTLFLSFSFIGFVSQVSVFTGLASQFSVYSIRVASFSLLGSHRKFQFTRVASFSLLGSRRKFQFTGFASQVAVYWIRVASFMASCRVETRNKRIQITVNPA